MKKMRIITHRVLKVSGFAEPRGYPLGFDALFSIGWGEGGRRPDEVPVGEWGVDKVEVSNPFPSTLNLQPSLNSTGPPCC